MKVSCRTFRLTFLSTLPLLALLATPSHAAPGDLDPQFGSGGRIAEAVGTELAAIVPVGDGRVVLAGSYGTGPKAMWASRRMTDGARDAAYGDRNDSWAVISFDAADLQCNSVTGHDAVGTRDGGLLIVGTCDLAGGGTRMAVARLTADGRLDPTFHGDGRRLLEFPGDETDRNSEAYAVALTPDGTGALVGGQASRSFAASGNPSVRSMALARIDANTGVVSNAFGELIGQGPERTGFQTYAFNGRFDNDAMRTSTVADLTIDATGGIAVTGQVVETNGTSRGVLRLLGSGDWDPRFSSGDGRLSVGQAVQRFGTWDDARGIAVLPTGDLVLSGASEYVAMMSLIAADGTSGPGETTDGVHGQLESVVVDGEGRQLVAGWRLVDGTLGAFVERRVAGGSLVRDVEFGGTGRVLAGFGGNALGNSIALDGARGVLLGANGLSVSNETNAMVARIATAAAPPVVGPPAPSPTPPSPPPNRVVVDTVAPVVRVGDPKPGTVRRTGGWTFSGAADPTGQARVRVQLYRSGSRVPMAELSAAVAGTTWSVTGQRGQVLADGAYEVEAVQADGAGNVGRSGRVAFRIDVPRPKPENTSSQWLVGRYAVGQVLGVTSARQWTPTTGVTFSYRWERCRRNDPVSCTPIPGRTARNGTYQLADGDAFRYVRVKVTARNEAGRAVRYSHLSGRVAGEPRAPRLAGRGPRIEGRLAVGSVLRSSTVQFAGSPRPRTSFAWQRCWHFGVCRRISTAETYRVQEADSGYRLRVTVTAQNEAGSRSVDSSQTPFVEASPLGAQGERIVASYKQAFGDAPSKAELAYWRTRGDLSLRQLVAFHRQGLRGNRALAARTVRNAYVQAYGHAPNKHQARAGYTARDVDAVMRAGQTYDELVPELGRRLARQAFDKVYFWDPALRRGTAAVINRAGTNAEQGVRRGEQVWTDVALSNDAIHGAARTSYKDGEQGAAPREACFGGIGQSCKGVAGNVSTSAMVGYDASGEYERFRPFVTEDGRPMGYIRLTTAVGSIMHDAVCRSYVGGAWCKQDIGNTLRAELPLSKWFDKATLEWDKATFNSFSGRTWDAIYGPYPLHEIPEMLAGSSSITYSDDLRFVDRQERYTEVTPGGLVLGFGNLLPPRRWGGVEVRATTRLKAPRGTALDSSDRDFCASRRFASTSAGDVLWNAREFLHGAAWLSQPKTFGRCA